MKTSDPPLLRASSALFLDFDGTLVPLAPRPQDVQVPAWVVPTVRDLFLRLGGAVAVVSGRPLAQLDSYLAPLVIPTAGSHGAQRRGPSGVVAHHEAEPPPAVLDAARRLATAHEGLLLESKPAGFALHYRARPELESVCRDTLVAALAAAQDTGGPWAWLHGHFVFELKQRSVHKGRAVDALMAEAPFTQRLPVFVGDDRTDEDGIAAAQAAGGHGVRVGSGDSQARYRLDDVEAVGAWLRRSLDARGMNQGED